MPWFLHTLCLLKDWIHWLCVQNLLCLLHLLHWMWQEWLPLLLHNHAQPVLVETLDTLAVLAKPAALVALAALLAVVASAANVGCPCDISQPYRFVKISRTFLRCAHRFMAKPKSKSVRLAEFPLQRFCMVEDLRPRWDENEVQRIGENTLPRENSQGDGKHTVAKIW